MILKFLPFIFIFKEALILYQQALITNSKSFDDKNINSNPTSGDYISPFITMSILQKKAVALEKRHFTKSLKTLKFLTP